jgi:hypothetical protein
MSISSPPESVAHSPRAQRQAEVVAALGTVLPRESMLFRHEDTAPMNATL